MKLIPLTKGYFAQVDDEDYEYLNQWKWCILRGKRTVIYAQRIMRTSPKGEKWAGRSILMHRLIMKCLDDKTKKVDHVDMNGLNNCKSNMRLCSDSENMRNRNGWAKSGYTGVRLCKKMWECRIYINKKNIYLGCFKTKEEAALAYNEAAIKYHGEFARLNIIK